MNQLPLDVQLIVFKYIHARRLHIVFKDMMIQLRKEQPYLRTLIDNCIERDCRVSRTYCGNRNVLIRAWHNKRVNINDMTIEDYWKYPYWYYELSDNFIRARAILEKYSKNETGECDKA